MAEEEQQPLFSSEKKEEEGYGSGSSTSLEGEEAKPLLPDPSVEVKTTGFFYEHRHMIPGYATLQLLRKARPYALYVLFALLIAYLLNQLDRYTLPITATAVGIDLRYGDKSCMVNPDVTTQMLEDSGLNDNFTTTCTSKDFVHSHDNCVGLVFTYNDTSVHACRWWWDGTGIVYQILAGPVFNNFYIFAGIFVGFLADYGNRKIFLVASLVFWSLMTLLTGLAKHYWHLVVLRALLAIGAAGCSPFAVSILGDYFEKEMRGTALGVYYWGIYIGYSLAFAIGNGIEGVLTWNWVFYLSGIVGIVAAPIILFTVKEPKRKKNPDTEKSTERGKLTLRRRFILIGRTFLMPGMFLFCIAAGVRNAGGYVWAYNTQVFFEKVYGFSDPTIAKFMSWIPLVGGALGVVLGGLISDLLVKNRGTYFRVLVLIASQILAAPFAAGALFLPYPWCFLSLIPSNVIGEMWVGVASAIVVDLTPSRVRTGVIAVYLFIITAIGGNFNLLVDPLQKGFEKHHSYDTSYRLALLLTYPGVYAISSLLFFFTFFLMRWDLRRKKAMEDVMMINESSGEDERKEEEEN